jgi:hypothetical protein
MGKLHENRRTMGVKQWKRELERMRAAIGRQHDRVLEHMRADETSLLEALYSFAESKEARRNTRTRADR